VRIPANTAQTTVTVRADATLCPEIADGPGEYLLIIKPVFDDEEGGVRVVHHRDELLMLQWPYPLAVGQSVVPGTGVDLKLYVVGREVFAARTPSPLAGRSPSEPVTSGQKPRQVAPVAGTSQPRESDQPPR
jgi:hypothetical protein